MHPQNCGDVAATIKAPWSSAVHMHVPFSTTSSFLSNSKFHLSFRGQTNIPGVFFLGGKAREAPFNGNECNEPRVKWHKRSHNLHHHWKPGVFGLSPETSKRQKVDLNPALASFTSPPRAWRSKPRRVKLWWNETGGGSFWLVKFLKKNPWHGCKKWANLQEKWFFCWSVLVMLLGDESEKCWNDTIFGMFQLNFIQI